MKKWFRVPFDSELFGENIYKLVLDTAVSDTTRVRSLVRRARGVDRIFCFSAVSPSNAALLGALGFRLMGIRNTYRFDGRAARRSRKAAIPIVRWSTRRPNIARASIRSMARTIGFTSRYVRDTSIPIAHARSLYEAWVLNSLFHGYADEAFVAVKGARLVGLVTLRRRDTGWHIDLLGVHKSESGKGLGAGLVSRALAYLSSMGANAVYVVADGDNIPANRLYERAGFVLHNVELVYHKRCSRGI